MVTATIYSKRLRTLLSSSQLDHASLFSAMNLSIRTEISSCCWPVFHFPLLLHLSSWCNHYSVWFSQAPDHFFLYLIYLLPKQFFSFGVDHYHLINHGLQFKFGNRYGLWELGVSIEVVAPLSETSDQLMATYAYLSFELFVITAERAVDEVAEGTSIYPSLVS